jgi:hypothetical protein
MTMAAGRQAAVIHRHGANADILRTPVETRLTIELEDPLGRPRPTTLIDDSARNHKDFARTTHSRDTPALSLGYRHGP